MNPFASAIPLAFCFLLYVSAAKAAKPGSGKSTAKAAENQAVEEFRSQIAYLSSFAWRVGDKQTKVFLQAWGYQLMSYTALLEVQDEHPSREQLQTMVAACYLAVKGLTSLIPDAAPGPLQDGIKGFKDAYSDAGYYLTALENGTETGRRDITRTKWGESITAASRSLLDGYYEMLVHNKLSLNKEEIREILKLLDYPTSRFSLIPEIQRSSSKSKSGALSGANPKQSPPEMSPPATPADSPAAEHPIASPSRSRPAAPAAPAAESLTSGPETPSYNESPAKPVAETTASAPAYPATSPAGVQASESVGWFAKVCRFLSGIFASAEIQHPPPSPSKAPAHPPATPEKVAASAVTPAPPSPPFASGPSDIYRAGELAKRSSPEPATAPQPGKAELEMGDKYYHGKNLDYAKSAYWFRKSAQLGNASAQAMLGRQYFLGIGVAKDKEFGMQLLGEAATTGDSRAQMLYGACLYEQTPLQDNERTAARIREAFAWFQKSIDQGGAQGKLAADFKKMLIGIRNDKMTHDRKESVARANSKGIIPDSELTPFGRWLLQGARVVPHQYQTCPACKGTGKMTLLPRACATCGGSGTI